MGLDRLISLLTAVCSSSSERSERSSSPKLSKGSCKSGKSNKSGVLLLLSSESSLSLDHYLRSLLQVYFLHFLA